ncbi:unnamed protein product [Lepeophtheirus salmonis]|uniref:(salmon louse) hypothetical protein n=1 Tax=Lepeophtheirus salmonis TaxID=72036 RepID=A0A7R8D4G8_LEPSM|nr:unnamed protein product [Lepeophtheirus salmonis]CAF3023866.1 unnamed protein product [Lepeophtheirus salmonis]
MSSGDHTALSSVDSGFNDREDGAEGSKYLQDVLGDILSKALSLCARHRPQRSHSIYIDKLSELVRRPESNHHPRHMGGGGFPDDNEEDLESDESIQSRRRRIRRSRRKKKSTYDASDDYNLRETAGSEPVPQYSTVESKTPSTLKRSSSVGNRLISNLPYDLSRFDPKLRNLSMKVPTVALPPDEYRRRRGFKWLPPMKDKPEYDASSAEDDSRYGSRNVSNKIYGQPRRTSNKKLEPLSGVEDHGEKPHKKSKKKVYNNHHVRVK